MKITESRLRRIIKEAIVSESLSNFTDKGIPENFIEQLIKKVTMNHDAKIEEIDKMPKLSDMEVGKMIISVDGSGNAIAVTRRYSHESKAYLYNRYELIDGKLDRKPLWKGIVARKGMAKGKLFIVDYAVGAEGRDSTGGKDVDTVQREKSDDILAGSAYGIYGYMNKVFLPRMKPELSRLMDDVFSNMRKFSGSKTRTGDKVNVHGYGFKSQRVDAVRAANAIEAIAEEGFSKETMHDFLEVMGRGPAYGFGSIPRNNERLADILKNDPLARQKWAKVILGKAKKLHSDVMGMLDKGEAQ